jgi:hypothetical protein
MRLRRFSCVMTRVSVVTVGQMGVVPSRFVPACFVVLRSFPVMTCCVLMVFSCFMMMLCRFLRHSFPPNFAFTVLPASFPGVSHRRNKYLDEMPRRLGFETPWLLGP